MVPNHSRERDAHCHGGEYQPHPVAPLPEGEGRILPVITAPFLTPLLAGEGSGVRNACSSVALAIVSRPRVVTHLNPSTEFQFLDTSSVRISISSARSLPSWLRTRDQSVLPSRAFAVSLLAAIWAVSYKASAQDAPPIKPLPLPTEKPPVPPSGEPEPLEPLPEIPPAQPVPPASVEAVPPPHNPPTPSERPASREEMQSHEATDDWNGLLGPFQIGPVVGAGLPSLINFGVAVKLTRYVGAGINIGIIPTLKISYYGQATLAYQEYASSLAEIDPGCAHRN